MTFTDIFSLPKSHQDELQEHGFVRVSFLNGVQTRNVSTLTDGRIDQAIDLTIIEYCKRIPFCRYVQNKTIQLDIFELNVFLTSTVIPLPSDLLDGEIQTVVVLGVPPLLLDHTQECKIIPRLFRSWKMSPWLLSDEYPLPYPTAESHEIDGRTHIFWNEFRLRPSRFRFAFLAMHTDNIRVLPCRLAIKHTLSIAEDEYFLVSFVSAIHVIPDSDDPDHLGYFWHTPQETLDARSGTYTDHTVLLCSIVLERGATGWVVFAKKPSTGLYACVLSVNRSSCRTCL
jgi:hypothetical protein